MTLEKFMNYDSFKALASEEDLDMIRNKDEQQLTFFDSVKEKISDKLAVISKETNIAVFSSSRCPDAATATPLLLELSRMNSNIHIKFYDKEEYKDFLLENLNETKIPTFLNIDSSEKILAKYCEFPVSLKRKLTDAEFREDADKIIADFRSGIYNKELLNELIELVLGCEHTDYISFDKTILPYRNGNETAR